MRRDARRAEQQLSEQQGLLQGIVNHFPGVVFQVLSERAGVYQFSHVSEGSIELLELPPAQLEADSDAFFRLLQKPDAARLYAHMKRSADTLSPVNWEGRVKAAKSGMIDQRADDAGCGVVSGELVRDRVSDAHGLVAVAHEPGEPHARLDDRVECGELRSLHAVTRHRAVDEARKRSARLFRAEAEPLHRTRAHVVKQNVRLRHELAQPLTIDPFGSVAKGLGVRAASVFA